MNKAMSSVVAQTFLSDTYRDIPVGKPFDARSQSMETQTIPHTSRQECLRYGRLESLRYDASRVRI
jgi:hypothetical protein